MDKFLFIILRMSVSGSIFFLLGLILRKLFQRLPKETFYRMWVLLFLSFVIPFRFSAPIQPLIPVEEISDEWRKSTEFSELSNIQSVPTSPTRQKDLEDRISSRSREKNLIQEEISDVPGATRTWSFYLSLIWGMVFLLLLIHAIWKTWSLKRKLSTAISIEDNVYSGEDIHTAFVFGLIRPKIYLPLFLAEEEREYILCHERVHIRRGDHLVKPLCYLLCLLHWFNPMVWFAFLMLSKDMELSCDERVLQRLGTKIRADYSTSLLQLAVGGHLLSPTPLAFSENDTKGRVRNIMNYRTPKFWMKAVALFLTVVFAAFIFTSCESSKQHSLPEPKDSTSTEKESAERKEPELKKEISNETPETDPDSEIREMKQLMTDDATTPRDWAEAYAKSLLEMYEKDVKAQDVGLKFSEYEITEWKKIGDFDGILEKPKSEPLTVYRFDCALRLEPKERAEKFGFAGGGHIDEDGWFREFLPMGNQYLIFRGTEQNAECIGVFSDELSLDRRADMERNLMNWSAERGLRTYRFYTQNPEIAIVRRYNFRGEVDKFLLTQPVKYGEEGIWRIEYYMDKNGQIYPYMVSQEFQEMSFDPDLKGYAEFLQKSFDEGRKPYLSKPEEVVRHWHPFLGKPTEYPLRVQKHSLAISSVNAFTVFFEPDVQEIYGFVEDWEEENQHMNIDAADLLDESMDIGKEKLEILKIPAEKRKNGKYLYNPWSGPDSWARVNENSKFYVRGENGELSEISQPEIMKRIKNAGNEKIFWKFEIKEDILLSATEWELP